MRRVGADAREGQCDRTGIALGAVAHGKLHGDGAVTTAPASHTLRELDGQANDQCVTGSAKSLRAGIPLLQADVNRDTRHDDGVVAVAAPDGDGSRRWWAVTILPLTPLLSDQFCPCDKRPGSLRRVPRCFSGILHHCAQSGA